MGFGSYDESEQQRQNAGGDDEDADAINVHANDHDGSVRVESDVSTDDLVARLGEMRRDDD